MPKKILIITGPTASGKTAFAIECAKRFDGEIISADSMQIYKKLNIGTAKPTDFEKNQAKHHMIDFVEPNKEYSVQEYVTKTKEIIKSLLEAKKLPIIVGGTGFYIKSLLYSYEFCNAPKDEGIREKYKVLLEEKGKEFLFGLLQEKDEDASKKISPNDTKRVIRALEILDITGKSKSEINNKKLEPSYDFLMIGLNIPREQLYDRINLRVDKMFEEGLLDEITELIQKKEITREDQSMQAIGYKEFFKFFDNEISLEETKELIKKNSRNYAKRQITFMKGFKDEIHWFDPILEKDRALKFIEENL